MKLTAKERSAITMLRKLDARQREKLLGNMQRQLIANAITARVSGLTHLKLVDDKRIEKTFGAPPWRPKKRQPKNRGNPETQ